MKQSMQVDISRDECPENPREAFETVGTLHMYVQRFVSGDKGAVPPNEVPNIAVILPIYMNVHSGVSISTIPFDCPWDSGYVGTIYVTDDDIDGMSEEQCSAVLEEEIKTFNQFLTGDIWGYTISTERGDVLDSCYGFYGIEYCRQEAAQIALQYQCTWDELCTEYSIDDWRECVTLEQTEVGYLDWLYELFLAGLNFPSTEEEQEV